LKQASYGSENLTGNATLPLNRLHYPNFRC
jgi:hypothetical protein